jgi:hypothetical protein
MTRQPTEGLSHIGTNQGVQVQMLDSQGKRNAATAMHHRSVRGRGSPKHDKGQGLRQGHVGDDWLCQNRDDTVYSVIMSIDTA